MAASHFRLLTTVLIVGATLTIGGVGFWVWNQNVENEPFSPRDNFSQPGGQDQAAAPYSGEEESEEKPGSRPAEGARTYQVDPEASRVYVKVNSATRLGHPHGVEGRLKSGKITLGGEGELVFDMDSFKADTKEARKQVGLGDKEVSDNEMKKVNDTMRSAAILDVTKYPTATCKITAIKPVEKQQVGAPGTYQVDSRFTLHGAEKPLQFKARLGKTDKPGVLKLSGSFAIKQTDHDMKPYSAAGGLVKVADKLEILGELLLSPAK